MNWTSEFQLKATAPGIAHWEMQTEFLWQWCLTVNLLAPALRPGARGQEESGRVTCWSSCPGLSGDSIPVSLTTLVTHLGAQFWLLVKSFSIFFHYTCNNESSVQKSAFFLVIGHFLVIFHAYFIYQEFKHFHPPTSLILSVQSKELSTLAEVCKTCATW